MLYFKDVLGPIQTNFKISEKLISPVAKRERGGWYKKSRNNFSWPTVARGYMFFLFAERVSGAFCPPKQSIISW